MVHYSENTPKTQKMLIQGPVAPVYGHPGTLMPIFGDPPSNWSIKHVTNNVTTFWLESDVLPTIVSFQLVILLIFG